MPRPSVTRRLPTLQAWESALSVASYLNTSSDLGISFNGNDTTCCVSEIKLDKTRLIVFSDASFGRDIHPFAGGFVQWRNGPISWLSRKAKFVPQSSCEIEVFAVVLARGTVLPLDGRRRLCYQCHSSDLLAYSYGGECQ